MKITFLGTGTSTGIPTAACTCPVCTSANPKDKRLRCSVFVEIDGKNILIDTTPDLRQQLLTHNINKVDAVLYTHSHFDHIGGFDDLRALNFAMGKNIDIFISKNDFKTLHRTFKYAFVPQKQIGGGVPGVNVNIIGSNPFKAANIDIIPIPMKHGIINTCGFRIGDFAYCTDTNFIPNKSIKLLNNLNVLVLDALRYTEHSTHYSLYESVEISSIINAKQTYFTHIAHQIKHDEGQAKLNVNFQIAFDGLIINS